LKFFLSREVPTNSLEFIILCFGGQVLFEEEEKVGNIENDQSITHQIVDRGSQKRQFLSRVYIQPQWVFDCVNEGILLDTSEYGPTSALPPHLSPFVDDEREGYVPARREYLERLKKGELEHVNGEGKGPVITKKPLNLEAQYQAELQAELSGKTYSDDVKKEKSEKSTKRKRKEQEKPEEEEEASENKEDGEDQEGEEEPKSMPATAHAMMTKKNRRLYQRMQYGIKKKQESNQNLMEKRRKLEQEQAQVKGEKKKKRI